MVLGSRDKRRKDTGNCLERYKKSFLHAFDGIKYAVRYEHNFIIIILAIIVTTIFGFACKINNYEWIIIVICFALVFGCELLNSSIEAVVDLETTKENKLAKIAKDCGSGATLIFSIMSLIVALIIFIPKIF